MAQYCTLQQAIRFARLVSYEDLGFDNRGEFEDHVNEIVEGASRFIDDYCKRPDDFFSGGATITEYHDGYEGRSPDFTEFYYDQNADEERRKTFYLNHYPIISVTSVKENTASIGNADSWSTRATTDYRLNVNNGILKFSVGRTPKEGFKNVEFIYVAGYASIPQLVNWVCGELVGNFLQAGVGDRSAQYIQMARPTALDFANPQTFTKEMERKLKRYVKRR